MFLKITFPDDYAGSFMDDLLFHCIAYIEGLINPYNVISSKLDENDPKTINVLFSNELKPDEIDAIKKEIKHFTGTYTSIDGIYLNSRPSDVKLEFVDYHM